MIKANVLLSLCLLATIFAAGAGQAAPTLDQQSRSTNHMLDSSLSAGGVQYHGEYEVAQTFTVGKTGRLTSVFFGGIIKRPGTETPNLLVSLLPTSADGAPLTQSSDCIAQVTVLPGSIPATGPYWTTLSVDLTTFDLRVTTGKKLAMAIKAYWPTTPTSTSLGYYQVRGEVLDSYGQIGYGPGMYYSRKIGLPNWIGQSTWDLDFQTYVDTTVPEPGSLLVLACGLVGAALRRSPRV